MSTADRVYEDKPEDRLEEGEVFTDPFDDGDVSDIDKELAAAKEPEGDIEPTEDEFDEPEKFKGKSRDEVIKSYMNAEKELGRKAAEVGQLRKVADEYILKQLDDVAHPTSEAVKEKKEVDVDYLLDDPEHAISELVNDNPRLKALEDALENQKREKSKVEFEAKHTDWQDVIQSQDFMEWVAASPIRQKMLLEADQKYDYSLADELFGTYKELRSAKVADAKEKAEVKREESLKKAGTERSTTGESPAKVYRRKDLIKLKNSDPDRYAAMSEDIYLAYQEGRVR